MRIYTKTGDKGQTSLFNGQRVQKNHIRIEAYGSVDELNSFIGLTITKIKDKNIQEKLSTVQNNLFDIGADLATPLEKNPSKRVSRIPRISSKEVEHLEREIDKWDKELKPLRNFILPGGSEVSALLHCCRTICRRTERLIISLTSQDNINPEVIQYINRLSDWLFVLARVTNHRENIIESHWIPKMA